MKKVIVILLILIPFKVRAFGSSAKSAILMDMDSKRILYGKDINYTQSVASIISMNKKTTFAFLVQKTFKKIKFLYFGTETLLFLLFII